MATPLFRRSAAGNANHGRDTAEENRRPPPKPRVSKKAAAAQKRTPQRGLGVAQLERLRLQERWKKIAEIHQAVEPDAAEGSGSKGHPVQIHFPVYDFTPQPPSGYAMPWGESYFLQRQRPRTAVAPVQYTHPMFFEHPTPVQYRGVVDGSVLPELSSNQSPMCFSNNCDLCLKNRALGIGEKLGFTEWKLFGSDEVKAKAKEPKEYEFFPNERCKQEVEESDRRPAEPTRSVETSITNSSFIDLSLKLSF